MLGKPLPTEPYFQFAINLSVLSKYQVHVMEEGHFLLIKHLMRSAFFHGIPQVSETETRRPKRKAEAEVRTGLKNLVQILYVLTILSISSNCDHCYHTNYGILHISGWCLMFIIDS